MGASPFETSESVVMANKYARWRSRVQELLSTHWDRGLLDVQEVAATVVGMFDAGADDAEVAAFLRDRERSEQGGPWLTDDARLELAHQLHMAAGLLWSSPSAEEGT